MKMIVSVAEMIQIEQAADRSGHSYAAMMEHAGTNLAQSIHEHYPGLKNLGVCALVGKGNNGGDALVALDLLARWGWRAAAYLVNRPEDPLLESARQSGVAVSSAAEDPDRTHLKACLDTSGVLMDGVLGTGIRLPLRGEASAVLGWVKSYLQDADRQLMVVAVDCPSGIDCDTGEAAAEALKADRTVTMAAVKQGLLAFPAASLVGELEVAGIGLPDGLEPWERVSRFMVDREFVRGLLPKRPVTAHKGTFGTALVVGGSRHYTGAALLAGKAAFRTGAGWVTLAVPDSVYALLAGQFLEATWLPMPEEDGALAPAGVAELEQGAFRASALLMGPGFGLAAPTRQFIRRLMGADPEPGFLGLTQPRSDGPIRGFPPLVLDADALKLLAGISDWPNILPAPAVLTPHPGEMSVLTGLEIAEIERNRVEVAEKFSASWGHVVVLKGAHTVVADPDGWTAVVPVATPALARAGTGDVLAGMITGLRAQGLESFEAATAGAWLHAQAGLQAAANLGTTASVLAGDVLEAIPQVLAAFGSQRNLD
jgi:NAD(P)H-hydrate epimerase